MSDKQYSNEQTEDPPISEYLVEFQKGFWIGITIQYLIFLSVCIYVVYKLKNLMQKSNQITIAIFAFNLLVRELMYTYIQFYFSRYQTGPNKGKTILYSHFVNDADKVETLLLLRLINNLFDFIMILVFYYVILMMNNFWDIIFLKKITEINQSGYDFRESEKQQLEYEEMMACQKIKNNKQFRKKFICIFTFLNVVILLIQILKIYTCSTQDDESKCKQQSQSQQEFDNGLSNTYAWIITFYGCILFIVDTYMIIIYNKTVIRFIQLLYTKEQRPYMRLILQIICLFFFSFVMFTRAISENLLRTGSKLTNWVFKGIDIKSLKFYPSYDMAQTILVIFQTFFPTLIGFIMLYIYYYLGVNSQTMIDCIDGIQETLEESDIHEEEQDKSSRQTVESYLRFSSQALNFTRINHSTQRNSKLSQVIESKKLVSSSYDHGKLKSFSSSPESQAQGNSLPEPSLFSHLRYTETESTDLLNPVIVSQADNLLTENEEDGEFTSEQHIQNEKYENLLSMTAETKDSKPKTKTTTTQIQDSQLDKITEEGEEQSNNNSIMNSALHPEIKTREPSGLNFRHTENIQINSLHQLPNFGLAKSPQQIKEPSTTKDENSKLYSSHDSAYLSLKARGQQHSEGEPQIPEQNRFIGRPGTSTETLVREKKLTRRTHTISKAKYNFILSNKYIEKDFLVKSIHKQLLQ